MNIFQPKERVNSIFKIDLQKLKEKGLTYLLMDIDNTLVPLGSNEISKEVKDWIEFAKRSGFKICLISNSIRIWRAKNIANTFDVPLIVPATKPFPFHFQRALRILNATAPEAAMIGDQLFMDILGGNILKIHTILVKPMTGEMIWYRKLMRWLEERVLNPKS
ncbi:MAG: YqeG family HAD IIIA-type phosphatase [Candidatus Saganbacteria bacterium]|nr:YqeG family HAD IIIA-type phosphatase [Candidatus Saganbacteria bacterium]